MTSTEPTVATALKGSHTTTNGEDLPAIVGESHVAGAAEISNADAVRNASLVIDNVDPHIHYNKTQTGSNSGSDTVHLGMTIGFTADDEASAAFSTLSGESSTAGPRLPQHFGTDDSDELRTSARALKSSAVNVPGKTKRSSVTTFRPRGSLQEITRTKLNDISMKKLHFERNVLYGREAELELLKDLLNEVCQVSTDNSKYVEEEKQNDVDCCCHRGLVMIEGLSGMGKTTLARQLARSVNRRRVFFATGKFDLPSRLRTSQNDNNDSMTISEPLAAIQGCVMHLVDHVLSLKHGVDLMSDTSADSEKAGASDSSNHSKNMELFETIQARLCEMKADMQVLVKFVPNIRGLIGSDDDDVDASVNHLDGPNYKESADQLNYALRALIQVITESVPVVLVCDDLQWCDSETLTILKSWVNMQAKSLIVVGCYRADLETNVRSMIKKFVEETKEVQTKRSIKVLEILLTSIKLQDIVALLTDLLGCDEVRTRTLAEVVLLKTGGNPFAIQQYIMSLTKSEMLRYNVGLDTWIFDAKDIRANSVATENVVALMMSRIKEIPSAARVLPIAACFGTTFSITSLQIIARGSLSGPEKTVLSSQYSAQLSTSGRFLATSLRDTTPGAMRSLPEGVQDLRQSLNVCEEGGLIISNGRDSFSFCHDKVQEAALAMLPDEGLVKFLVGEILWWSSTDDELEESIFEIVALLRSKINFVKDSEKQMDLARLHYQAGRKAMTISAFQAAAQYFKTAVDLVSSRSWTSDQNFCIDLYSSVAEAEYCVGGFEQTKLYSSRIMQLDVPPVQKLRMSFVMVNLFWVEERPFDAVTCGVDILSQLGCHIPTRTSSIVFQTVTGLMAAKRYVKILTPEFIESLPLSKDPVHAGIMKMLEALVYPCHFAKPEIIPLLCIQMIKRTLKHGVTPWAPYAFAFLGFVLFHIIGDMDGAAVYVDQAFLLLEKYNFKDVEPRTIFMINAGIIHWMEPYQKVINSFVEIYEMGMRAGDCETGMVSIFYYLDIAFYTGRDLEALDRDLEKYMFQSSDFNQQKAYRQKEMDLQAIRNLRGKSENTTTLTGTVMNQEERMQTYSTEKEALMLALIVRWRICLACYLSEYQLGADLIISDGDKILKALLSYAAVPPTIFMGSLCCFAEARGNKNRKYKRHALKYRKLIKRWSQRNPNCVFYLLMLDAEKLWLSGNRSDAKMLYEKAKTHAGRMGAINDQALANERLAESYLDEGSVVEATYCFERSLELYSEWKAMAKVAQLRSRLLKFGDMNKEGPETPEGLA